MEVYVTSSRLANETGMSHSDACDTLRLLAAKELVRIYAEVDGVLFLSSTPGGWRVYKQLVGDDELWQPT